MCYAAAGGFRRALFRKPATFRRNSFSAVVRKARQVYDGGMTTNTFTLDEPAPRPVRPAMLKGWRRRCPHCGEGHLFEGYLKVKDSCESCGEDFSHHRADDAPSWLTMIIVGHLIAPFMVLVYELFALPVWAHAIGWPVLALALVVLLLPGVKGVVVAFQWAHRMHGFDQRD